MNQLVNMFFEDVREFFKISENHLDEICLKATDNELDIILRDFDNQEISTESKIIIEKYFNNL
jgi:hypothetical protein